MASKQTESQKRFKQTKRMKEDAEIVNRAEIARLRRRGWSITQIAEHLEVHPSRVSAQWKVVVKQLQSDQHSDTKEYVAQKLEEYAEVKREAWEAWERSKAEMCKIVEEQALSRPTITGKGKTRKVEPAVMRKVKETMTKEYRLAANEYLNTILRCLEAERELLALDPVKEMRLTATLNWDALSGALGDGDDQPDTVEQKLLEVVTSRLNESKGSKPTPSNREPEPIEAEWEERDSDHSDRMKMEEDLERLALGEG